MKIFLKKLVFLSLCIIAAFAVWHGVSIDYSAQAALNSENHVSSLKMGSAEITESGRRVFTPASIAYGSLWTRDDINAVVSIPGVNTHSSVIVAVLDTGIDGSHVELSGRVASEINFSDSVVNGDVCGHGTPVAGIIAADAENAIGISGIAPQSRLLNVKVADDKGKCLITALTQGIYWAVENGAKVINISIEFKSADAALRQAVDYAWNSGAVVVAAAGNDGASSGVYPAAFENCLAVTAVRENGELAPLANYGDWVDVAAPGFKVYSLTLNDDYGYYYGTSFAAACVSGLAARLFSLVTDLNEDGKLNNEVVDAIKAGYPGSLLLK